MALALAAMSCAGHGATTLLTFAAFGDMPYNEEEESRFPDFIAELNREESAFVVHVGDIKSAASACTDSLYLERRRWFKLSRSAFAYLPGDNDWLDCRRALFDPRDPAERLQKLRALFFSNGDGMGQAPLGATRQSEISPRHDFPEHFRWQLHGVLFVTLNIPGPNNNSRDAAERVPRSQAVSAWLDDSFRLARERNLLGLVVFVHAAPWTASGALRRAFGSFIAQLGHETRRLAKPVLLIHGDEHQYLVDKPLRDGASNAPVGNFTRVEVFGSPGMNWVRVRVIDDAGRIRWEVTPGS